MKIKLSALVRSKADPSLCRFLESADKDDQTRVVFVLDRGSDGTEDVDAEPKPAIRPTQFSDRVAYRKALINRQVDQNSSRIGATVGQLEQLPLKVQGGKLTRAVVAEGTAEKIVEGLMLPGVHSATLDQSLSPPTSRKRVARH